MKKYLIDVNLPYYFSFWNGEEFIHQRDINDQWPDEKVWQYAKENNLTIITKDSDFSNKILFQEPPPRVIHVRIGNVRLKELYSIMLEYWEDILEVSRKNKLVNVFKDRIEGIN